MSKKLLSIALVCSVFFLAGCKDKDEEMVEPIVEKEASAPEVRTSVPTTVKIVAPDEAMEDSES